MSDYTITIRMRGDDQLSNVVKQVSGEVQNLGTKSEAAGNKTGGLKSALGQFKSELLGLGTAFGVVKFAQFIGDMNELGMQVNAAQNTFTSLSGGAASAASNLELMQVSTRGVVDDMTLMNAANRLLLMGLASSGDEAAKLAGGAVALGKAMGQDAQTSVEGFAALLANKSIPRLDNFGISAARVRERIDELKASGMGIDEAFNVAVLAEMQISLDKLGPSLDANATAFERWGTRIKNTTQDFASNVAAGAEGFALAFEVITQTDPGHEHLRQVAKDQAAAYVDTFISAYGDQFAGREGEVQAFLQDMFYRQMTGGATDALALSFSDTGMKLFPGEFDLGALENVTQQIIDMGQVSSAIRPVNDQIAQMTSELTALAREQARLKGTDFSATFDNMEVPRWQRNTVAIVRDTIDEIGFQYTRWSQIGSTAFQTLTVMGQRWQTAQLSMAGSMGAITAGFTALGLNPTDFGGQMMDFQIPQMSGFVSADELTQMTSLYQNAQLELQNIQTLAAQGLIPQTEVDKAQNMVTNLGAVVGQLQTIQQLSDITGQTGGGIMGELGNIVMGQAGASGMTDETIAALQRQINLASGAETVTSVALEEQAAPLILAIAEQVGPEAAAQALQSLNEQMQNATIEGLSQDQIAKMIPQMTGFQMNAAGMVAQIPQMMMGMMSAGGPMIDAGMDATGTGGAPMSMSGEMAALQESLPTVSTLMLPIQDASSFIADNFGSMETSMTGTIAASDELNGRLTELPGDIFVKVHIEPDDPNNVLGILNSGAAQVGSTVRNNGGRVPGRDSRISD